MILKNILNSMIDYINVDTLNQSELLLRRDIYNVCTQMPEMHDLIQVVRDAIVECNVSTGEVSRSIMFEYHDQNEEYENQVKDIEKKFKLLTAIKNFIVPRALMHGETYVQVIPYSKLFAELNQLNNANTKNRIKGSTYGTRNFNTLLHESVEYKNIPDRVKPISLNTKENLQILTEAVSPISMLNSSNDNTIANNETNDKVDKNQQLEMTKIGLESLSIDANTFQFFPRSPRGGKAKELDLDDVGRLENLMKNNDINVILAHAPYIINLASKSEKTRMNAFEIFFINRFIIHTQSIIIIIIKIKLIESEI